MDLLPSPSSLSSLRDRPMNQRRGAEARKTTLFGKPADWEDGRLVSPKNHLLWVWMPVSFIASERERRWGSKVKGPSVLQNISWNDQPRGEDVLVSFFLQPFTGGQGSLRQAIMYDYNNKSNKKQGLKSKKQIQRGVRFSSFPVTDPKIFGRNCW